MKYTVLVQRTQKWTVEVDSLTEEDARQEAIEHAFASTPTEETIANVVPTAEQWYGKAK